MKVFEQAQIDAFLARPLAEQHETFDHIVNEMRKKPEPVTMLALHHGFEALRVAANISHAELGITDAETASFATAARAGQDHFNDLYAQIEAEMAKASKGEHHAAETYL